MLSSQIPLSHFHSGEVSSWSALNSPRVVELFGVVREGPNVVLFMELKQGHFLKVRLKNLEKNETIEVLFCVW